MTEVPTLAQLADEASGFFERRSRSTGDEAETFVALRDNAPEWLSELVRSAHGDMLPDDWRYRIIERAVDRISDYNLETSDDAHDAAGEFADGAVDIYTADRLAWLASNLERVGYCDRAAGEFGDSAGDIVATIGLGQYAEASEVYGLVVEALEERRSALETEMV
jgi:hypothetical protein